MRYFVILTIALFICTLINTEAFAGVPVERVPISSFDVYSLDGEKIKTAMVGQQVNFVANITNTLENNQSFVYGVMIEENGARNPIGLIESSLDPKESSSYFVEWTPNKTGNYLIEGTVWESTESFTAFSAVWQAMIEVIPSTSIEESDYLEQSKIENIDGNLFRVFGSFPTMPESNESHKFEGVEFSNPHYPTEPVPPGGVFIVDITFDDRIKESIGGVGPYQMFLEFTDHKDPQAGVRGNSEGGFDFLISVENQSISPLKQFNLGIRVDEIECRNGLQKMLKHDGTPACVTHLTAPKIAERGWNWVLDLELWEESYGLIPSTNYVIKADSATYGSQYIISGAIVNAISYDQHTNSLKILMNSPAKGILQIVIPSGLLHLPTQAPFSYFVLADGEEIEYEKLSPIILKIPFDKGTEELEIIGIQIP